MTGDKTSLLCSDIVDGWQEGHQAYENLAPRGSCLGDLQAT